MESGSLARDTERAMAEENIEVVRRLIDSFNRGDTNALAVVLDRESEWDWSRSIGPDKGIYRGPEEILRFSEEFVAAFAEVRIEIEDLIENGNQLVAAILSVMRGRGGIEVEARNAWAITMDRGKLRRLEMFQTKDEALAAAGLSE
jgi:ketosteroid isomerase-like protein